MKVAFPNGFHYHEHRALDNAVAQSRNTQWAPFSVFLRNVHPASRVGLIGAGQKLLADIREFLGQMGFHLAFPNAINARRMGPPRHQRNARSFGKPDGVCHEAQETVKPSCGIFGGPCGQLALQFTDYQRSSPLSVR